MITLFNDFIFHFQEFEFIRIALIATLLVTLICGLLSPLVVLKQRSYIGETLSHVIFPGVIFGYFCAEFFQLPFWLCLFLGASITALLGTYILENILKTLKIPNDAAAIICLTSFFAIGIIQLSKMRSSRIDPGKILFGDVLTLSWTDISLLAVVLGAVSLAIVTLKKHWNAWLSDPEFAEVAGFKVKLLDKLFPVLVTFTVLTGLFAVGGLMISALLTFPAVLYQPRSVVSFPTLLISVTAGLIGFCLSFQLNWPVGPSIVVASFAFVLIRIGALRLKPF
ncbi:MAG: metal ABC transporter permease [Silvanigrellaceae bacterium]|nr:metal ABC transporter permease [Silvanigrellaceae bacterium]